MIIHTRESVRRLIAGRMESDAPDLVLEALKAHFDSKLITTRIPSKLNALTIAGFTDWRLSRHYGWTSLETLSYRATGAHKGMSLILARSESAVSLDTAWVEKENAGYFEARRERNRMRTEAINSASYLDALTAAMNQVEHAITLMTGAKLRLDGLLQDAGRVTIPDSHEIERACGLTDSDGHAFGTYGYTRKMA